MARAARVHGYTLSPIAAELRGAAGGPWGRAPGPARCASAPCASAAPSSLLLEDAAALQPLDCCDLFDSEPEPESMFCCDVYEYESMFCILARVGLAS